VTQDDAHTGKYELSRKPVTIQLVESIAAIPQKDWDALVGAGAFFQSHAWLRFVEREPIARARYVLAQRNGVLVGALPLYKYYKTPRPRYRIERFRSLLSIEGDYLIAGARRGLRTALLVSELEGDTQALAAMLSAAMEVAASERCAGLIIPFMPTADVSRLARLADVWSTDIAFDDVEAVLQVVGTFENYAARLPRKRRYTTMKERRRYLHEGLRTSVERLEDCLEEVASLVSMLETRHGHSIPDFLLRRVFRWQVKASPERPVVLTCRTDDGQMVACTVNYAWRGGLYNQAVGMRYALLREAYEYFNLLIYEPVSRASELHVSRIHLSIASRAKLQRGADAFPLWTAVLRHSRGKGGVHILDPDASNRWRREMGYVHAFPEDAWQDASTLLEF